MANKKSIDKRKKKEAPGEFSDMDEDALEAEIQKVEAQLKTGNEKEKEKVKKHKKKREVKAEAKIAVEAEVEVVKRQVKSKVVRPRANSDDVNGDVGDVEAASQLIEKMDKAQ
jgi:hypothetical protein